MKRTFSCIVFILAVGFIAAQDNKNEAVKTGWNFGVLPTVSYDTDLGFQYGALVNLYDYGDGTQYPSYNHSLYLEYSRYTKGSQIFRSYYDTDKLIKGVQTSFDLSFLTDMAYDFYGYNGYEAVVNYEWFKDTEDPEYKTRMFYKYDRKMFRFKADFQGKLAGEHFKWMGGLNLLNFKIGLVDIDKLNKGKDDEDKLPTHEEQPGLFQLYQDAGVISAEEADGGFVPALKAGLVYDSRDNRPNPMKGIWTEAGIETAPEFLGAESSFAKFFVTHRQYFTIVPEDLSFAYRLGYQSTLGGNVPFYYQSQVITSVMKASLSEGLGGRMTLRGVSRNRVLGDGFFYGNIEARWKFWHFQFIKNNWYMGLNGFMDFGQVTSKIEGPGNIQLPAGYPGTIEDYYDPGAEKMHISYGAGLRVVMNQNFIIAVDYGMVADDRDGNSGLYIGLNYLF